MPKTKINEEEPNRMIRPKKASNKTSPSTIKDYTLIAGMPKGGNER